MVGGPSEPGLCSNTRLSHYARFQLLWSGFFLMQSFNFPPDDHSRVHLTPVEGVPDSDYINASFINVSVVIQRGNPRWLRPGRQ